MWDVEKDDFVEIYAKSLDELQVLGESGVSTFGGHCTLSLDSIPHGRHRWKLSASVLAFDALSTYISHSSGASWMAGYPGLARALSR